MPQNLISSERTRTLLVLAVLAEGDQTGFEIIRTLETKKDFAFSFEEGMVYPILYCLCDDGYVTRYFRSTEVGKRCFYKLTRRGVRLFRQEQKLPFSCISDGALGGGTCVRPSD